MGKVVQLPKLLAWAPDPRELRVHLSAILVAPGQEITRDLYLMFLGERIQALVNASDDPGDATEMLQRELWDAGLYPDLGFTPADQAGARLVEYNPGTRERLDTWDVLPNGKHYPQEMAVAREVLMGERYDPLDSLQCWVGLLSRMP